MLTMENSSDKGKCPKCGSWDIYGAFKATDLYEKRGSKLVRKRGVEFLDTDYVCRACGHKWSVRECVKGVRFRSMPAESCSICRSKVERET